MTADTRPDRAPGEAKRDIDAAGIVDRFLARANRTPNIPSTLLIDGHSGSGKTTLAAHIQAELAGRTGSAPQILAMDELYAGWDGLAPASDALAGVLEMRRYRRYNWATAAFGWERTIDAAGTLIVEGCGSISDESLEIAARAGATAYAVWVACPTGLRRDRALERDGDIFAPHWERWAAQERALFARTQPIARAAETVHSR